jgi:DNA-directed RNA polymerase subunit delta
MEVERSAYKMQVLAAYSKEEVQEMSMIEIAFHLLSEAKKPYDLDKLITKIAQVKAMPESEVEDRIAQFYTDLNIDGRFMNIGDHEWGLKEWYPVDKQQDEEITLSTTKERKRRKKKSVDVEDDLLLDDDLDEDYDDFDDEDDLDEDYDDESDDFTDEIDDLADDEDEDEDEEDEL